MTFLRFFEAGTQREWRKPFNFILSTWTAFANNTFEYLERFGYYQHSLLLDWARKGCGLQQEHRWFNVRKSGIAKQSMPLRKHLKMAQLRMKTIQSDRQKYCSKEKGICEPWTKSSHAKWQRSLLKWKQNKSKTTTFSKYLLRMKLK